MMLLRSRRLLTGSEMDVSHQMHCGAQVKVLHRSAVLLMRQKRQKRIFACVIQAYRARAVEVCSLITMLTATRWQSR